MKESKLSDRLAKAFKAFRTRAHPQLQSSANQPPADALTNPTRSPSTSLVFMPLR